MPQDARREMRASGVTLAILAIICASTPVLGISGELRSPCLNEPVRQVRSTQPNTRRSGRSCAASSHAKSRRTSTPGTRRANFRATSTLDHILWIRQKNYAIMRKRRLFLVPRLHIPGPGELEAADILSGNLIERAIAPRSVIAPPHQPVLWIGPLEHVICDRLEHLQDVVARDYARALSQ
jgi:hypothetical protein